MRWRPPGGTGAPDRFSSGAKNRIMGTGPPAVRRGPHRRQKKGRCSELRQGKSRPRRRPPARAPLLVVSDRQGNIFEVPGLLAAGMSLAVPVLPRPEDFVPLPEGSNLFMLLGRIPIGFDPEEREFVRVPEYGGEPVFAVAAFMAPAWLQLHRSACEPEPGPAGAERLSLYSYTATGWQGDRFCAAGMRIDPDPRQDLANVHLPTIERRAREVLRRHPGNRLVAHLVENCVFRYGCPAARNFAMGRWECPVPTSPYCNSRCLGCLSRQPASSRVCAAQDRLPFVPTVAEIVEFTVPHLEAAPRPVISFGQGCEGEPLMVGDLLEEAIREIRRRTGRGVINLNTNASRPDVVERLCAAGLDSIRVSVNSVREPSYRRYYLPQGYTFGDVVESLRIAAGHGLWTSINYLMFPGFTDQPEEVEALGRLISSSKLNMIQTRNLNIDPDWYIDEMGLRDGADAGIGMRAWVERIRARFPALKLGYFNPPREEMIRHMEVTNGKR